MRVVVLRFDRECEDCGHSGPASGGASAVLAVRNGVSLE